MKRMLGWSIFGLVLLVGVGLFCKPAHAGASPFKQLSLSVGAQGRWLDTPYLDADPDFEGAGNAALTLTPHIDLTAGIALGIGGSYLREQADARISLTEPGAPESPERDSFSVWVGGGYYWSDDFEDGLDGWAAKGGLGWQPTEKPLVIGLTAAATPKDGRSSITLSGTWTLKRGGE